MRISWLVGLSACMLALLSVAPVSAATMISGATAAYSHTEQGDLFLSGTSVSISAPVEGEAFAVGSTVTVSERLGRSGFLAGTNLTVSKGAGYNLFAAGSVITLDGDYGNDVYVAGNTVNVLPTAVINGDLHVSGGALNMAGEVKGNVFANAQTASFSGKVGGNVSGQLPLLSFTAGSIGGDLRYQSDNEAQGTARVSIAGKTVRDDLVSDSDQRTFTRANVLLWLLALVTSLLAGMAFIWLLPRLLSDSDERIKADWARAIGAGAALFFLLPIAAGIAGATVIGAPISVVLFMVWAVLLILAWSASQFVAGRWVLERILPERAENPWLQLLVGSVLLGLLAAFPFPGWLVLGVLFFALYLPAMGSLGMTGFGWARGKK